MKIDKMIVVVNGKTYEAVHGGGCDECALNAKCHDNCSPFLFGVKPCIDGDLIYRLVPDESVGDVP